MLSRRLNEVSQMASAHPGGVDPGKELSSAWKSLSQTKAALRHIENRLEAVPGTGVLLNSVMDTKKASSTTTRKISNREGRHAADTFQGQVSKSRTRSCRSPEKSSRSPLRTTTLDSNVRRTGCVEFKEPLASYREPSPLPLTSSQHEAQNLMSVVPPSPNREMRLSQLVYRRDTRDQQTSEIGNTFPSAPDNTVVRYLNDRPALDALRQPVTRSNESSHGESLLAEAPQSSSPSPTSQRLENLRRKQPDDKLEKLKERIRRQREHLEEAAEAQRMLECLQQPRCVANGTESVAAAAPIAKVRKVAAAPPAPVYKGFNPSVPKVLTPTGKEWCEEDFQKLSTDIYPDLSVQLAAEKAQSIPKPVDRGQDKKPCKPVRKVHKWAPQPTSDTKPAAPVISTSSWREGQKLVEMVLGPTPRLPRELRAEPVETAERKGPPRAKSDSRTESCRRPRASSTDSSKKRVAFGEQVKGVQLKKLSAGLGEETKRTVNDFLPSDMQGILDDLQLDSGVHGKGSGAMGSRVATGAGVKQRTRSAPASTSRTSRSTSPIKHRPETAEAPPRTRHYDANSVRQYITRQQEERRKRQQEERRAQRQEAERRNHRLQELYRKQREGVSRVPPTHEGAPQKRLQETYSKLLLEQAKLEQDLPWTQPILESLQPKPLYQPSGESDKENKRLDRPQSASSSSDLSLSEPPAPLLTRAELDLGPAWLQADSMRPPSEATSSLVPPAGHLFTQLLGLDTGTSGLKRQNQNVPPADELTKSKTSRIEALKAKAASISTRIETEARKLAMAGISSGHASGLINTNAVFSPQVPQDKGPWIKPCSPPEREDTKPNDLTLKLQQLLSAGQSGCDGTLPGVGNLHTFGNLTEAVNEVNKPRAASVTHLGPVSSHESEHDAGHLNSSVESISEGPLLSEGSLSDHDHDISIEGSIPKPVQCIGSPGFCMAERDALHPIARFQREAQKYHAFSSLSPTTENRSPWEELAKGSPHSVINIFTKNLHSYSSAIEQKADQGSQATRPAISAASPLDSRGYEDDFISSHSAGGTSQSSRRLHSRLSSDHSVYSPHDELLNRRSPSDVQAMDLQSLHSSGSTPVSSPHSADSLQKQAVKALEENSMERTLVDGQKPTLDGSGSQSQESKQGSPGNSHPCSPGHGTDSDATLRSVSGLSALSLVSDGKKSPRSPAQSVSPASGSPGSPSPTRSSSQKTSPDTTSSAGARHRKAPSSKPPNAPGPSSASLPSVQSVVDPSALTGHRGEGRAECKTTDELQYTPGVLQHRMSAELSYLDAIEESVRQLADVERLRGVSLAQQESVSLAQILKAQQQRHEHDLLLLKLKAEKEELETRRQLEETRQRAARAHAELQENVARSRQESLGSLQEATTKMIGQQAEAVRYTSDAARHIREMTELAHSHIAQALNVPATPVTALFDQQRQQHHMRQIECHVATDSRKTEGSSPRSRTEESVSSLNSPSESTASRTHALSTSSNEIAQVNLSRSDRRKNSSLSIKEVTGSSVEEEAHVAADTSVHSDSIPSLLDEKDNTSVATEYSLKFDESMTEDEIEERSFRSLLPSESHRRGAGMEKKRGTHEESEDEACQEKSSVLDGGKSQEGSVSFSNGQDSFSKFTMDMVRQYMKEEEVRAQHQNSLLRLREKALKEKTKAELAWLEHQKRHLRDKGEDDKMPPIRKRQRGLLLKLQQEQAEIKRLQEANKAARKERQLLLKQQEEIERLRHTTLKIKERLKSAGETQMETSTMEVTEDVATPVQSMTDLDTRSPSPISVSGSETSSIMQKLKKMRCHMDEKHCSPVHYFFSVFTAHHWASLSVCFPNLHPKFQLFIYSQLVRFLTKREQQLMRRRRHAEELLEWKQRLDAEEAEVRRMEKQALAAWDGEHQRDKRHRRESASIAVAAVPKSPEAAQELAKDSHSADNIVSSLPTEPSVPEDLDSPSTDHPVSELPSPHKDSSQDEHSVYSQDFDSSSESKSPIWKAVDSVSRHPESSGANKSSGSRSLYSSISLAAPIEPSGEQRSTPPSEPTSDQSDIESRIRALKEELRKRKSVVCQLKKEQRKRHKERLKAQEASLLKQLESYNEFIQKTKAELDEDLDMIPTTKPQIKTPTSATEKPRIKPPPVQRPETSKHFKVVTELEKEKKVQLDSQAEFDDITPSGHSKFTFMSEEGSSEDDHSTMTPTPVLKSPDHFSGLKNLISSELHSYSLSEQVQAQEKLAKPIADSGEEVDTSSQKSEVEEQLECLKSDKSAGDSSHLLKVVQEQQPRIQQEDSLKDDLSARSSEGGLLSKSTCDDIENVIEKEDLLSSNSHSNKLKSLHEEQEQKGRDEHLSEINSSIKEHHYTPEFDILLPDNDRQVIKEEHSDAYLDDFESSADSSPHEGYQDSKPSSHAALDKKEETFSRSHTYTTEEDIGEELGEISFATSGSSHSGVILDVKSQAVLSDKTERENKEGVGSLRHSPSVSPPQSPMFDFNIGDRVLVSNVQLGTLRFKGLASFAKGFWAGVELDESEGSNNGTYDGVVYFECKERHGIFAPPDKISRVPEKLEVFVDTSEDEDSFDEPSDSMTKKEHEAKEDRGKLTELQDTKQDESKSSGCLENKTPSDMNEATAGYPTKQTVFSEMKMSKQSEFELYDLKTNTTKLNGALHPTPNGTSRSIILEFEDISNDDYDLLITEARNETVGEIEKASTPILDLLAREKDNLETQQISSLSHQTPEAESFKNTDAEKILDEKNISSFADNLLNNFLMDAIKQLQNIKKNKTEKITVSNQLAGENGTGDLQETTTDHVGPCITQSYLIPSFIEDGQEVPSPELYIRPESPVLGASGQEELAKRLAELELSRELLDDLGDEQDWFDEDFGLSSRKEQQKRQQSLSSSGPVAFEGGERTKILAKPEHPQHAKPTEEPAMVVPHTSLEVKQLVHSATQVIWNSCSLGQSLPNLVGVSIPIAPEDYYGCNAHDQDLESLSKRSYRQVVFDLTWEIIQEIFAEDPNAHQPQWVKPRRMNSSYFHRVKCPSDISEVQDFVTNEVLKLLGLKKDQNQKTDWQKMLKFGRKKRDRVDQILVQELHEEESQWVNYDEDELFVKMQLADGIFDALMKDTIDVFLQIQEKQAKRIFS
ncbi:centrosome-associated protein 350 isoform X2 [Scleropages formosus]|uniref:centrosome-associated protein 350 isoform X2 n=1 Tax=Scleropages formosus TaxID=113540 RepID=UPI0010FA7FCC|nr:centrosome-associated protein 350 isoform X2 [Scleropages formosus]